MITFSFYFNAFHYIYPANKIPVDSTGLKTFETLVMDKLEYDIKKFMVIDQFLSSRLALWWVLERAWLSDSLHFLILMRVRT